MGLEFDFAGRSIQGRRDDQEDFFAIEVLKEGRLLVVLADGAGGQIGGELASRSAAMGFLECFAEADGELPKLPAALTFANRRLAQFIESDPERHATMATTLLAVLIEQDSFRWISVGDSPLLLIRQGVAHRLNADHSGAGLRGKDKMAANVLRSALVGGRIPLVDWRRDPYPLQPRDVLLAASDGLWTLSPIEVGAWIGAQPHATAIEIAEGLLHLLEAKGKTNQDNATIAVIKVA